MASTFELRPRKLKTFRLDERLINALNGVATKTDTSIGAYVEAVLWRHCQGLGSIPIAVEPIHDQRGGKRSKSVSQNPLTTGDITTD